MVLSLQYENKTAQKTMEFVSCVLILGLDPLNHKRKKDLNLCHVSTQDVDVVVHLASLWPIIPVALRQACLISILL